ncbi:MAG TPA: protein phosphatase 2C domain-containing protein [Pirellulaceae bacterium]|nr:protein phosphatase 2C domain-containing protein [Pirellulaceae bacterium]
MHEAKNTARAMVRIGYDGRVHKFFKAADARERFENELRVLLYLERRECPFVPRVSSFDRETLELVTTNCGARVEQMSEEKMRSIFAELESFGVRHDDPYLRNITYRASDGRFCVIDFEFATILEPDATCAPEVDTEPLPLASGSSAETPVPPRLRWSGRTECGCFRSNNEDSFVAVSFDRHDLYYLGPNGDANAAGMDFVFAVSDGMGGERSGEFASRFALDNITRLLSKRFDLSARERRAGIRDCLTDIFLGIHRQLTSLGQSYEQGQNMGATLSLAWIARGWIYVGHIGDSRIYRIDRDGEMRQLTEDHTHVGWLRRHGKLNEREARFHPRKNVLSQSLGSGNRYINPQLLEVPCAVGDRLVICSDGVTDGLWDRAIRDLIVAPESRWAPFAPAERLVRAALEEGSRDNATAMVIEIG